MSYIRNTLYKFSCVCIYERAIKKPISTRNVVFFLMQSENRFIGCNVATTDRERFRVKTMMWA